uniref:Oligosaccharide repeat unit polymerase n=1 Tax=Vibrio parahaemolyticus TaxID=670 RepID=A0A7M1WJ81_VIBPH|nr:hypothetical protein VP393_00024 [Vibrio parahaemolyticus]
MVLLSIFSLMTMAIFTYIVFKIDYQKQTVVKGIGLGLIYFVFIPLIPPIFFHQTRVQSQYATWSIFSLNDSYLSLLMIVLFSIIWIILCQIIYSSLAKIKEHVKYYECIDESSEQNHKVKKLWLAYCISGLGCVSIITFFLIVFKSSGAKWTEHHEVMAVILGPTLYSVIKMMSVALMIVSSVSIQSIIKVKGESITLTFLYFMIPIYEMITSSNRIYVFTFAIIYIFLNVSNLSIKKKLTYSVGAFFAIYFFILWGSIRAFIHDHSFIESLEKAVEYQSYTQSNIEQYSDEIVNVINSVTEGTNVYVLKQVIDDFPNKYEFITYQPYLKILSIIIPRTIWPDKPESAPLFFANLYNPEIEGFSLNGTILAEGYASFGFLGMFTIIILMSYVLLILKYISNNFLGNYFSTVITLFFGFMCVRYGALSDVVLMVLFTIISLLIINIMQRFIK